VSVSFCLLLSPSVSFCLILSLVVYFFFFSTLFSPNSLASALVRTSVASRAKVLVS
jgi:hypothetical protein